MKIGTVVDLGNACLKEAGNLVEEKLKFLYKYGFETCMLNTWSPSMWTEENAELLKGLLEKYHVTITAVWVGWQGPVVWDFYDGQCTLGLVPPEYRQMRIKNLCDGADFAKRLGVKDVATHMGFIPENPYDPIFNGFCVAVRTVAQHLERNGQRLLFETGQETPTTLVRCFEKVGTSNLGVNLDTANLILYGKANPVDALDLLGNYVCNMHAKDGFYPMNGHSLGKEAKIGCGKVDFKAIFAKLREYGYDSHVTIEREITGGQQLQDILDSREYLQNIINEVYGR